MYSHTSISYQSMMGAATCCISNLGLGVNLKYLLLETDGPYVKPRKPDDVTGKQWEKARNTSLILPAVAVKIAELKGIPVEDVYRITEENTKRIFRI